MKEIIAKLNNSILTITINRPESLNALNKDLIQEIGTVLTHEEAHGYVSGVIITGAGDKAFAAGADIKGFPKLNKSKGEHISREGHEVFDFIETYPRPVIAVINGYALGGGLELAMACHMRIAEEQAIFGMPETKLGLIPGYGGTQRLAQLIGKAKALEYILTAETFDANKALDLGLVNYIEKKGEGIFKAVSLIKLISKNGPDAISAAIEVVHAGFKDDVNGYELEIHRFGDLMNSDQCKEGVQAFLEKRKPNFNL